MPNTKSHNKNKKKSLSLSLKASPFGSKIHLDPLSSWRVRKLEATYKEVQSLSQGETRSSYKDRKQKKEKNILISHLIAAICVWEKGWRLPTVQLQHPTIASESKVALFIYNETCKIGVLWDQFFFNVNLHVHVHVIWIYPYIYLSLYNI